MEKGSKGETVEKGVRQLRMREREREYTKIMKAAQGRSHQSRLTPLNQAQLVGRALGVLLLLPLLLPLMVAC